MHRCLSQWHASPTNSATCSSTAGRKLYMLSVNKSLTLPGVSISITPPPPSPPPPPPYMWRTVLVQPALFTPSVVLSFCLRVTTSSSDYRTTNNSREEAVWRLCAVVVCVTFTSLTQWNLSSFHSQWRLFRAELIEHLFSFTLSLPILAKSTLSPCPNLNATLPIIDRGSVWTNQPLTGSLSLVCSHCL